MAPLTVSMTSVLGGLNNGAVEAGTAIAGAAIAALPLVLLAAGWRQVVLSFRGRRAEGQVTRIERTAPRTWKGHVSFRTADGREVTALLGVPRRVRPGDSIRIRYDPARPASATSRSARSVGLRFLLPAGAAVAVGLAGLAGTLYTAGEGGFGAFFSAYATAVLVVVALFCFFTTYLRYAETSWWHGKAVADGTVDRIEVAGQPGRSGVYPSVSFTTRDGRRVGFQERSSVPARAGSKVAVYYDPEFPEQTATLARRPRAAGAVWMPAVIGAAALAAAVVLAVGQLGGS